MVFNDCDHKKKAFVSHEQIKTSQTDTNQRGGNDLNIKLIFFTFGYFTYFIISILVVVVINIINNNFRSTAVLFVPYWPSLVMTT